MTVIRIMTGLYIDSTMNNGISDIMHSFLCFLTSEKGQ